MVVGRRRTSTGENGKSSEEGKRRKETREARKEGKGERMVPTADRTERKEGERRSHRLGLETRNPAVKKVALYPIVRITLRRC